MPYEMHMNVDGACRGNRRYNAIAAAAVVIHSKSGHSKIRSTRLPNNPTPTNQSAELTAVIQALHLALAKHRTLDRSPLMQVTIKTDSKYALGCLTQWKDKWIENGWLNAKGKDVTNKNLIKRALNLINKVEQIGDIQLFHVKREQNEEADAAVNKELDCMNEDDDGYSSF